MGVSYFSCDECGQVMHDHGGMKSTHLEFREDGVTKDGTYCENCASEIKSDRIPVLSNLDIVFCLRKQDGTDKFVKFPELNKSSLLELIEDLKCCDTASVLEIKDHGDLETAFEEDGDNFNKPQPLYEYFIEEFIHEIDDDDCSSWIIPPPWPNATKKRARLQDKIVEINHKINALQTKANKKQRKLDLLNTNETVA